MDNRPNPNYNDAKVEALESELETTSAELDQKR